VDVSKGILVVAYPNFMVDTEFGFNYWLEAELIPEPSSEPDVNTGDNNGESNQ